jgi:putative thioredoxin
MSDSPLSFASDVLDRSREVPVLVDFWADWCGPCLMFGPILERAAAGAAGRWELIKINTEEYPEIAREHGIRSLPTIRLYVDGAAVGESLGVLPDVDLQRWLARHLPSPHASELKAAGEALARGAAGEAAASADRVLALEPENDEALWLKAQAALSLDPAGVPALLNAIPGGSPFGERSLPLRELAALLLEPPGEGRGADLGSTALGAIRNLDWNAACEALLALLERDRAYGDQLAARALKQIFLFLGPRHEVTERFQRRFASLLFS